MFQQPQGETEADNLCGQAFAKTATVACGAQCKSRWQLARTPRAKDSGLGMLPDRKGLPNRNKLLGLPASEGPLQNWIEDSPIRRHSTQGAFIPKSSDYLRGGALLLVTIFS